MAINNLNPTATAPTTAEIAAAVPTNSSIATAVAAAVPTNASITTIAQANGGAPKVLYAQTITSSTNWVAPTGVNAVRVMLVAGGGAGGGFTSYNGWAGVGGAGGGGGGAVLIRTLPVTPGTTYAVNIGAGGTAPAANAANTWTVNDSNSGGNTAFGNLLTAEGGGAGARVIQGGAGSSFNGGSGGGGAVVNGGAVNYTFGGSGGGAGGQGWQSTMHGVSNFQVLATGSPGRGNQGGAGAGGVYSNGTAGYSNYGTGGIGILGYGGGGAGGSYWGQNRASSGGGASSAAANGYGGGGGGAQGGDSSAQAGGAGFQGFAQLEWMQ